ncbi:MAG: beta-lactamase family protein [Planctomycetaceae bacterium]|nr:beta-lactamase family protein [Planctomycetaceae bacterium]
MRRRDFLIATAGTVLASRLSAAVDKANWDKAKQILSQATASGQITAASLLIQHKRTTITQAFGTASVDDMFLLGSISKPISIAALMTLYDQKKFQLDDLVTKYIPEFKGEGREKTTVRQLLTHVSGLPDQLPENAMLRSQHAPLSEFIKHAIRTPLLFPPGTKYSYSSMAILLAAEIAQRITGEDFRKFTEKAVYRPLEMNRSAMGLGRFELKDFVKAQVEKAAVESGAGDPNAKSWDWNSKYWRAMGAPWGAASSSVRDIGKFLQAFLRPDGKMLSVETAKLMVQNHNPPGIKPRGLGFGFTTQAGCTQCSDRTFGHTGSTGTLAWADPATETLCVVLTTLPGRAVTPHPRQQVSDLVAASVVS